MGKILVVDDDPDMQKLILTALQADGHAVVQALDPAEGLALLASEPVDVVITDFMMPKMNGVEFLERLHLDHRDQKCIMITGYGDVPAAVRAMKAGAIDFIEKPFSGQLLLDSIAYALKVDGQVRSAEAQREQLGERFARLTPRERQVMELVVAGRTNRSIASEFGVSEKTVEIHRGQVMTKMKAGGLAELVRIAALLERGED